jgi:hypothetical protein
MTWLLIYFQSGTEVGSVPLHKVCRAQQQPRVAKVKMLRCPHWPHLHAHSSRARGGLGLGMIPAWK